MTTIHFDHFQQICKALRNKSAAHAYVLADLKALSIWGNWRGLTLGAPEIWDATIALPDRIATVAAEALSELADSDDAEWEALMASHPTARILNQRDTTTSRSTLLRLAGVKA